LADLFGDSYRRPTTQEHYLGEISEFQFELLRAKVAPSTFH
jgi:hypothetical protein